MVRERTVKIKIQRDDVKRQLGQQRVRVDGRVLQLTPIQQTLLYLLAANAGRALSREDLLATIWGGEFAIESNVVWTVGSITFGLAIIAAISAYSARETFRIHLHDVVANDGHAVALVEWSARRDARAMEGQEIAVYHVRDGVVQEVWFTANNPGSVDDFFR